ncbi:MAG TPA: preprotein translocase subunit SecY [Jatrophihabitantaceae bacterium]|nr:preprotein translocase subunit SecY [Jatrophihabitantaceae bacterium]
MFSAFLSAFRTPDLRKKLLFTLSMIVLYRLGASIPTPNTNTHAINGCIKQASQGSNANVYSLINLFSGGALLRLSAFALGILPYITASIIIQLLVVVIPRFEQLKKEGQAGQQKLTQYSRYLTIGLAILQSTGFIALARSGQLFPQCTASSILYKSDVFTLATMIICMTAGTAVIMWLGELVTDRGVGNGMSVLMFTSIAARIPNEGNTILQNAGGFVFTLILFLGLAIIIAVIFVEQAQRRIPVQYAKRMVGRRQYGGTSTYLPLKVNQAGVIPVIFASSLLYIPQLISQLTGNINNPNHFQRWITNNLLQQSTWTYILIYFALIIFFTYFYVGITFDPVERADDMKKYGGFIPGIRPGRPTAEYLQFVLSRITLPGSLYLGIVAVLPNFFFSITSGNNQNFPFGGTAVLIMVGVGLDTVKQIESQLMQRNYEGFLR